MKPKSGKMNDNDLRLNGMNVLTRSLGPSAAYRFVTLLHQESVNYVDISKQLYKNQTIDSIFERSKKNWPNG